MLTNRTRIILTLKVITSIMVGLVASMLSFLFKFNRIVEIFAISAISTFIVLNFIIWSIKKAFKQNIYTGFDFNIFNNIK